MIVYHALPIKLRNSIKSEHLNLQEFLQICQKRILFQIQFAEIPANQRYCCTIKLLSNFSACIDVSCNMRCICVVTVKTKVCLTKFIVSVLHTVYCMILIPTLILIIYQGILVIQFAGISCKLHKQSFILPYCYYAHAMNIPYVTALYARYLHKIHLTRYCTHHSHVGKYHIIHVTMMCVQ